MFRRMVLCCLMPSAGIVASAFLSGIGIRGLAPVMMARAAKDGLRLSSLDSKAAHSEGVRRKEMTCVRRAKGSAESGSFEAGLLASLDGTKGAVSEGLEGGSKGVARPLLQGCRSGAFTRMTCDLAVLEFWGSVEADAASLGGVSAFLEWFG